MNKEKQLNKGRIKQKSIKIRREGGHETSDPL